MAKSKTTEEEAVTEAPVDPEDKAAKQLRQLEALRVPFPPDMVSKLPRGRTALDFVGHADLTHRLLDVDPLWNWEPLAYGEQGYPLMDFDGEGNPVGMWIKLTVAGVTRLGYGSTTNKNDAVKELIGDALRNAAMRFGAALDLWSKSDRAEAAKQGGDPGMAAVRELVHRTREAANRDPENPFVEGPTEDVTPLITPLSPTQKVKLKEWWAAQPFPGNMTAANAGELYVERIKTAIEKISNGEKP